MRALGPVGVAALLLALPAGVGNAATPSRLMVSGDEYSLVLSRQSIARGPALVQFVNRGEDSHDLKMKRIEGGPELRFAEVGSNRLTERTVNLNSGRYRLWCSLPGHARKGMRATLSVRR
jgi:hypothetical protein